MLFVLLLSQPSLLGKGPPLARQLLKADHLCLVGLEQTAVRSVQALQARA
jgi:hypothetical protein